MEEAVEILGAVAAVLLFTTITLGILFRRARLKVFKYHAMAAMVTVALGAIHGVLALIHWLGYA